MKLNGQAIVFVPDGGKEAEGIARTTHLAISAHEDDIEFMAYAPIAECFGKTDKWFGGVVVTDGAGSPRRGLYADYTDEQMKTVRAAEQKKRRRWANMVSWHCWGILLRKSKILPTGT